MVAVFNSPVAPHGVREVRRVQANLTRIVGDFLASLRQAGASVLHPSQARDAGHTRDQWLPLRTEAVVSLKHLRETVLLATTPVPVYGRVLINWPLLDTKGGQRIMKGGLVALDADQQGVAGCGGSREPPF